MILALAVAIGLLGADSHWLSDIVASAIVGVATGVVAAKIGRDNPGTITPTKFNAWAWAPAD